MEAGAELEQAADAPARGDLPAGRLDDPGDEPQQRRLAGAVATDEPDGLARLDVHRDAVERPDLLRPGAASRDQELLQRLCLAGAHDEPPRDVLDGDLTGSHSMSFAIVTNVSW